MQLVPGGGMGTRWLGLVLLTTLGLGGCGDGNGNEASGPGSGAGASGGGSTASGGDGGGGAGGGGAASCDGIPPTPIADVDGTSSSPSVVWTGDGYGAAWSDTR